MKDKIQKYLHWDMNGTPCKRMMPVCGKRGGPILFWSVFAKPKRGMQAWRAPLDRVVPKPFAYCEQALGLGKKTGRFKRAQRRNAALLGFEITKGLGK